MLLLVIGGLALLDSTAFGTLLIPVWLTMAPGQFRFGRIATYLAVVALSYYAIGLALLLGADALCLLGTGQYLNRRGSLGFWCSSGPWLS